MKNIDLNQYKAGIEKFGLDKLPEAQLKAYNIIKKASADFTNSAQLEKMRENETIGKLINMHINWLEDMDWLEENFTRAPAKKQPGQIIVAKVPDWREGQAMKIAKNWHNTVGSTNERVEKIVEFLTDIRMNAFDEEENVIANVEMELRDLLESGNEITKDQLKEVMSGWQGMIDIQSVNSVQEDLVLVGNEMKKIISTVKTSPAKPHKVKAASKSSKKQRYDVVNLDEHKVVKSNLDPSEVVAFIKDELQYDIQDADGDPIEKFSEFKTAVNKTGLFQVVTHGSYKAPKAKTEKVKPAKKVKPQSKPQKAKAQPKKPAQKATKFYASWGQKPLGYDVQMLKTAVSIANNPDKERTLRYYRTIMKNNEVKRFTNSKHKELLNTLAKVWYSSVSSGKSLQLSDLLVTEIQEVLEGYHITPSVRILKSYWGIIGTKPTNETVVRLINQMSKVPATDKNSDTIAAAMDSLNKYIDNTTSTVCPPKAAIQGLGSVLEGSGCQVQYGTLIEDEPGK
jgi:hypothetical protein